jgi:hypothetical protein
MSEDMRLLMATFGAFILGGLAAVQVGSLLLAAWFCVAGGYATACRDSGYGPRS